MTHFIQFLHFTNFYIKESSVLHCTSYSVITTTTTTTAAAAAAAAAAATIIIIYATINCLCSMVLCVHQQEQLKCI
jgi:hypothetical protein